MSHKTVVKLINYDQKFLDFLDFFLQENSLFFSFLTRNQKPRKMPCVSRNNFFQRGANKKIHEIFSFSKHFIKYISNFKGARAPWPPWVRGPLRMTM